MTTNTPRLSLLTRAGCHLCEVAARDLESLRIPFEIVDVDSEPPLLERYGNAIPVLLWNGHEMARAPISQARLRALAKLGFTYEANLGG